MAVYAQRAALSRARGVSGAGEVQACWHYSAAATAQQLFLTSFSYMRLYYAQCAY